MRRNVILWIIFVAIVIGIVVFSLIYLNKKSKKNDEEKFLMTNEIIQKTTESGTVEQKNIVVDLPESEKQNVNNAIFEETIKNLQ